MKKIIVVLVCLFSLNVFASTYEEGYRNGYKDGFKEGINSCSSQPAKLYRCTLTPSMPQYPPVQSGWYDSKTAASAEAQRLCVRSYCTSPECGICVFASTECEER